MIDIKLLKNLYKINSKSGFEDRIREFILNYLKHHYQKLKINVDSIGNIFVTKGKSKYYPTIVSHIDQVQQPPNSELTIVQQNKIITAYNKDGKQQGLGADDKNGVWIALQCLKTEPVLKCAFFVGEEIGCVGSNSCDMSFFNDSKWVIQCDRRNGGDFIWSTSVELCKPDWIPEVLLQKYKYSLQYGLMTDVESLKERGLNVACCNLSCGYYNPHTDHEYTNITELINCLNFVKEIIKTIPRTEHKYEKNRFYPYMGANSYWGFCNVSDRFEKFTSSGSNKRTPIYFDWDLYD